MTHLDHALADTLSLEQASLRGDDKHPTEKPVDQMLELVSAFSRPSERVLDVTAGRGSTGVACVLLRRQFVGFEIDEAEAELAQQRIDDASIGKLSARDFERVARWIEKTTTEAELVLAEPAREQNKQAQARAARRLADVATVLDVLQTAA